MRLETLSQIVLAALLFLAGQSYYRLSSSVDMIAERLNQHEVAIARLQILTAE